VELNNYILQKWILGFKGPKGILNNDYFCQSLKASLTKTAQVNGTSVTPGYLKYEYIETV